MRLDICIDLCMDMPKTDYAWPWSYSQCSRGHRHVYRHVCRYAYGHVWTHTYRHVSQRCIDMRTSICLGICLGMWVDMWVDMWYVLGRMYRHASQYVCSYGHIHAYWQGYLPVYGHVDPPMYNRHVHRPAYRMAASIVDSLSVLTCVYWQVHE